LTADTGYINARLKGMHSRFLKEKEWEELLQASSLEAFFSILKKTPYSENLEESLLEKTGLEALDQAFSLHWSQTIMKVRSFLSGPLTFALNAYLWKIDLSNLREIAITLLKNVKGGEIPPVVGSLNWFHLEQLAKSTDLKHITDTLVAWDHPLKVVFLELPENLTEPRMLELYLERGFFLLMKSKLRGFSPLKSSLRNYWKMEIDLLNIRSALFLQGLPTRTSPKQYFIPGGKHVSLSEFQQLCNRNLYEASLRRIARIGDLRFLLKARSPKDLEELIPKKRLENSKRRYRVDPLGAGVLLAFLEEKEFEIANLRLLGRSIYYQIPQGEARSSLVI